MGKEAKFGLALIVVLLVTFGVVLVNRFKGADEEKPPVASKEKEKAKEKKSSLLAKMSSTSKDSTMGKSPADDKPTVVAKKPAWTQSGSNMPDQWNMVSDDGTTTTTTPDPSQTSYMPDPPTPEGSASYDQAAASSRYQDYSTASPDQTAVAQEVSDPYGNRPGLGGRTSNMVNVLPSPSPGPSASQGYSPADQRLANPYGSASSGAPYLPTGGADSSRSVAMQESSYPPRTITRPESSYGATTTPISTYTDSALVNDNGQYEVQPNDSYWKISEKLYGSGVYYRALAEQNRGQVPQEDRLTVGDVISTPTVEELEKAYPDLCPKPSRREAVRNLAKAVSTRTSAYGNGPTYVVEEGDTLFDIARYELGKASRWAEIYELNRDILGGDYDYLVPGTRLTMPGDQPTDAITSRPGNGATFRR